jgi:hypothetical protein
MVHIRLSLLGSSSLSRRRNARVNLAFWVKSFDARHESGCEPSSVLSLGCTSVSHFQRSRPENNRVEQPDITEIKIGDMVLSQRDTEQSSPSVPPHAKQERHPSLVMPPRTQTCGMM